MERAFIGNGTSIPLIVRSIGSENVIEDKNVMVAECLYGLGIVLVALVVFGPALRPWYVIWGLIPLAAAARHARVRHLLTVFCAALLPVVLPDGFAVSVERALLAVLGGLIGVLLFVAVRISAARTPVWATR